MSEARRPIRVMNIITRLNVSGPSRYVTLLAARFGPPDYQSLLVCGTPDPGEGDMRYYAEQLGVEPVWIPELGRSLHPRHDLTTLRKLRQLIQDFQPDIVHTHTSKAGFIGRLAARQSGVPVIIHTFHGHIFRGFFNPLLSQGFIRLERLAAGWSDTLITLTDGLRRELAEQYRIARKKQITVLPLGLDLEQFALTPRRMGDFRAAWNIPPDAPLIGTVGRITAIKNQALFLEAAARVREAFPAARFVIVGGGELRPQIEARAAELGLRETVILTGWQRELAAIYSDLDALVISSRNEGTPVPVIEALAAGCPVVATAVGGLPDLLDGGRLGTLVEPGSAAALANGILEALRHPPDTGEAQRVMLDRYSIDRLVQDMDGLYRGLLAKKRPGRGLR
ncbi:MAG: glycosyltransferase family 1 protein [Chloroflexi bacterium]|nr:glycosyltransferase family 1 protein [Chloroflexota bacterium]MDL1885048.1 glycosyltransferase family 4 protein [Anaerolineae bacterium CFX8]